jgi:TRAP-type transport system periplasmic protein
MGDQSKVSKVMTLAVVTLLAAAGCAAPAENPSGTNPPATEPPATEQPKTLRIATDDDPDRPGAAQIEEFARQVKELSGGKLLIEPVWKAVGHDNDDWDQAVAQAVTAGDFEMALVPASMLAKVTEPAVADEMLAGLEKAGVSGLALFPEATRTLFSFRGPLLKPADLAGMAVRAPRSDTTYELLKAFGATPDDLVGEAFPDGIAAGNIAAAESSFAFADTLPEPTTATGNLTLYPKVNSLVINIKVSNALSETRLQNLKDAAAATRTWAVGAMTSVADDAAAFCRSGGTVVTATDAELAAFKSAGEAVYAKLEADPETKNRIARIRELAAGEPAPGTIRPCGPGG